MLYGMAEPMQAAIRRLGLRLRVYAPVGELVPGMAYLVRRLLENTSNESFVRHRFAEGRDLDELVAPPRSTAARPEPSRRPPSGHRPGDPSPYEPEPVAEWRRGSARAAFSVAVDTPCAALGRRGAGRDRRRAGAHGADTIASVDPGPARHGVVATSASCGGRGRRRRRAAARRPPGRGGARPRPIGPRCCSAAAEWMRERRHELAALEVFEAGKPWAGGRRRRVRGHRLLRVLRPGDAAARPGRAGRAVAAGRDQRAALPGQGASAS